MGGFLARIIKVTCRGDPEGGGLRDVIGLKGSGGGGVDSSGFSTSMRLKESRGTWKELPRMETGGFEPGHVN